MKVINRTTIYRGQPNTDRANCCFPAIARLANGTLLATWRVGTHKDSDDGTLMLARSHDGGLTWSDANRFPLGPYANKSGEVHYGPITSLSRRHILAALMWVDRSIPNLPLFNPQTEGLLPITTVVCESRDGGESWHSHRELDPAPYYSPMPITGPVLDLHDGRIACQFEVNKTYDDPGPWRHAAAWKISADEGHTWPESVEIANDPTGRLMYWDARYCIARAELCVATFWTYDRVDQQDANIHLSISTDGGRSWSVPKDTGVAGQICQPIILANGQLMLVYVDRFSSQSIRAAISDDQGDSFGDEVVVYQHLSSSLDSAGASLTADYLQAMNLWTFGRVEGIVSADDLVSLVYYAGTSDQTSIYFAQIAPNVRFAAERETKLCEST